MQRSNSRSVPFFHALSFVLGFSLVFMLLGVSVGLVGYLLRDQVLLLRRIGGVFLVIMGLHLMGVIKIPFLYQTRQPSYNPGRKVSYVRSFTVGSIFSIGWTPCIGPIVSAILTLAATSETVWQGAYLLVAYSLGLGLPFLAAGLALSSVTKYLKGLYPHFSKISFVSGLLLIAVGFLIFTNRLIILNRYFDFFGLGKGI